MKKIFSLITIFALAFSSCDDVIDIEQPGTLLADIAITNVEDLQLALLSVYNQLDNTNQIQANALFSDELAIGQDSGGQNVNTYSLNIDPNNGQASAIYQSNYIGLSRANIMLEKGDLLTISPADQAAFNNIKGQLLALRAYFHFNLLTYFSTDLTDDSALGVTAFTTVPAFTEYFARNTNSDVFTAIEADLTAANGFVIDASNRTFVSKDFITALRARIAAYRGDYATAEPLARALLGSYGLANQSQFTGIWNDTNDTEIIFELERVRNDAYDNQGTGGGGWAGSLFAFVNSSALTGSPFMEMSRSLFNELTTSGDVRRQVYVSGDSSIDPLYATKGPNNPLDILGIAKYPGHDGQPLMNDIKIFRSAEMLLIAAEARAQASDFSGVQTLLTQLRTARGASSAALPGSQQAAFAAVLAERRLELAFEGHRWVDLKRLGQKAGVTIDRDPVDCTLYSACTLVNTSHKFTLPIPLSEIDLNSLLVQNPGY